MPNPVLIRRLIYKKAAAAGLELWPEDPAITNPGSLDNFTGGVVGDAIYTENIGYVFVDFTVAWAAGPVEHPDNLLGYDDMESYSLGQSANGADGGDGFAGAYVTGI